MKGWGAAATAQRLRLLSCVGVLSGQTASSYSPCIWSTQATLC